MTDIIYYYPKENGAPSHVAERLFEAYMEKKVPFNLVVFPANKKVANVIKSNYPGIEMISLKQLIIKKNKSIVHFSVSPFLFPNKKFLLFLICLIRKNKIIINYHGEPRTEYCIRLKNHNFEEIILSLPNYLLMPFFVHSADVIILNSLFMKKLFEKSYGVRNTSIIPNALDSTWFDVNGIKQIYFGEGETCLFYHGRLSPEKGVDSLLKGLHHFVWTNKQSNLKIKLFIAGDGAQKNNLEKLSKELKLEKYVVFLGRISLLELKSYLISVDSAIYPSIYEPFSLAVLESFSLVNGPVVYSKNIGVDYFVRKKGFNFYTFDPTVEGIAKTIKYIYEKKYNEDIHLYQKTFSQEFTWHNIAMQYINIYKEHI